MVMKKLLLALAAVFAMSSAASAVEQAKQAQSNGKKSVKLSKAEMAKITAGSNANFPPGQFPSGNPAQAPGNSNPNTHPK
jgi:hypothetical protein